MLRKLRHFLSSPRIVFFVLPWVMVLVVLGTISQRYIGLYESHQLFFSSFILWLGPIPTPGMYILLLVLSAALVVKLVDKSPLTPASYGTVMTHVGALLLLAGGLITAAFSEEGAMTLAPGETTSVVTDYHERELVVLKNGQLAWQVDITDLHKGRLPLPASLPFALEVLDYCRNCEAIARQDTSSERQGIAKKVILTPAPLAIKDEDNRFGVTLRLNSDHPAINGIYMAYEITPHQPQFTIGEDVYRIEARKHQRIVPFSVQLDKFTKFSHPGTAMAREYESLVTIRDGDFSWQAPIRMNEPLRYRGYTLYQSSFMQMGETEYSVLAVVKNAGRSFPYISSLVMCLGLLIHLIMRRRRSPS